MILHSKVCKKLEMRDSSELPTNSPPQELKDKENTFTKDLAGEKNSYSVNLRWSNINAWIPRTKKYLFGLVERPDKNGMKKEIICNLSGIARSGEVLAIMGASGSGKTTFLNILTGRNHTPVMMTGSIYVNDRKIGNSISDISAYVQQVDLFIGTLKVREHLIFQSHLRMDHHIPSKERLKRVDEVIAEFGLLDCQDTLVGVPGRIKGISGGELKRLSLAEEILTDPPLLFCDEPTSGLDSFMAQNVFSLLKQMAKRGKTVITTVHQPSSEIFAMFDQLLLMSNHRVAYLGPANYAKDFFTGLGFTCPLHYNPADYFIQVLALAPGHEKQCEQQTRRICDAFADFSSDKHIQLLGRPSMQLQPEDVRRSMYKAPWWKQFLVVLWRTYLSTSREPHIVKVRFFQTLLLAVLLGLIFGHQDMTQEGVANINGAIYILITNLSIIGIFAVVILFTNELPIFLREHSNGMYRVDVYFLCKTLVDVPTFIILPLVFTTISYWMVGMYAGAGTFFMSCCISVLLTSASASFGYFISCTCGSVVMSIAVAPVINTVLLIFGGYYLNAATVPKYWIWIEYLSWYRYGNEALVINQWLKVTNISCPARAVGCLHNGHEVIKRQNFDLDNLSFDTIMLFVLIIGYRILALIALLLRARRKA